MKKTVVLILIILVVILGILFYYFSIKGNSNTDSLLGEPSWISEVKAAGGDATIPYLSDLDRIMECTYKGKTAYYLAGAGFDAMDGFFDRNHKMICSGGGLGGNAFEKCPDFTFNDCEIIWKNSRYK